jgi:hypothetical protein
VDNLTLDLDPTQVDTLRGFLGEVLADNDISDKTRHTLENLYAQLLEE